MDSSPSPPTVTFIPGQRGTQNAVVDGYRYTKNKTYKKNTYYCCSEDSCSARITLSSGTLTSPLPDHNHRSQEAEIAVLVAKNTIKERAATTDLTTKDIVADTIRTLDFEAMTKINCQISSLEKMGRRSRFKIPQPPSPPALPRRSGRLPASLLKALENDDLENKIRCGCTAGLVVTVSEQRGRGLQTTTQRSRGEFLVEYVGKLTSANEGRRTEENLSSEGCYMYFFPYKESNYCIDATDEDGTMGRLINHSRKGNCTPKVTEVDGSPRLYFVANRTIRSGEELLFNYDDRRPEVVADNRWLRF